MGVSRPWYHPYAWPPFVRWVVVLPATILAGTVVYFASAIVNGLGSYMPSGIVYLIAACIAGYAMSATAKHIAPNAKTTVAVSVVAMFAIACAVGIGNELTGAAKSSTPLWFDLIFTLVALGGATAGAAASLNDDEEIARRGITLPDGLRWLLLLPCAILSSLAAVFVVAFASFFTPISPLLIRAENGFLMTSVFIGVGIAMAPRGKKIIAAILAVIPLLVSTIYLSGGLLRPLVSAIFQHFEPGRQFAFDDPAWQQSIMGIALMLGIVVPVAAIMASRPRFTVQEEASA